MEVSGVSQVKFVMFVSGLIVPSALQVKFVMFLALTRFCQLLAAHIES